MGAFLMNPDTPVPKGWNAEACKLWSSGQQKEAIQTVVARVNAEPGPPTPLAMQLSYYLIMLNDYRSGATVLASILQREPEYLEARINLAVCHSRGGDPARAIEQANQVLQKDPDNALAHDILTSAWSKLGNADEARRSGALALVLKDRATGPNPAGWVLPQTSPAAMARQPGKKHVISYSLWGKQPRYLRGALRNALLAPDLYPGWVCRFHVDSSVPADFLQALQLAGAEVVREADGQSLRQKLCWRFRVANDPGTGYFLVRDVDSVIGIREKRAVDAWLESDRWFHVMRDWWTHTDLILAGMWGGVAGVLPNLPQLLAAYKSGKAETPNIDQWFLRDRVWPLLRQSVLVHDRCFTPPGALPFPGDIPAGNYHVGQDEIAVRAEFQERLLSAWIERYPSLGGFQHNRPPQPAPSA